MTLPATLVAGAVLRCVWPCWGRGPTLEARRQGSRHPRNRNISNCQIPNHIRHLIIDNKEGEFPKCPTRTAPGSTTIDLGPPANGTQGGKDPRPRTSGPCPLGPGFIWAEAEQRAAAPVAVRHSPARVAAGHSRGRPAPAAPHSRRRGLDRRTKVEVFKVALKRHPPYCELHRGDARGR
jgi:hypothetical protein